LRSKFFSVLIADIYLFSKNFQTGSSTYPASYSVFTGVLSPRVNWPEREADSLFPSNAGVNEWIVPPFPLYAFLSCSGTAFVFFSDGYFLRLVGKKQRRKGRETGV
jgi:hypothetical protein